MPTLHGTSIQTHTDVTATGTSPKRITAVPSHSILSKAQVSDDLRLHDVQEGISQKLLKQKHESTLPVSMSQSWQEYP